MSLDLRHLYFIVGVMEKMVVTCKKMNEKNAIAHVRQNLDGSWSAPQSLHDHIRGTASRASAFARPFASDHWAEALGLFHDVGKANAAWQAYLGSKSGYDETVHLEGAATKVEHSTPGALLAEKLHGSMIGRVIAYCVAGHHTGLPDFIGSPSSLSVRLQNSNLDGISDDVLSLISSWKPSPPPWKFDAANLDFSLWIRMLFSCLVDADFLDTEEYMRDEAGDTRGDFLELPVLLTRFDGYMQSILEKVRDFADSPVNVARRQVLVDCRRAADHEPGFFSLTVPTGGGKTLSSMAFALKHGVRYNKRRVIYVIPYTSIIEQNADVFREALGSEQIVEHHSSLDEADFTEKGRLAAENWDASVIVTTTVQFFESLFASRSSRCRKLHNIANSVVILDEVQLLPVEFLSPILETMRLLVEHYSVTFVFCTATQPAFEAREGFLGLPAGSVNEIITDVPSLYRVLRRVTVSANTLSTVTDWACIAKEVSEQEQALCVVSDRKSCRELYRLLPEGSYHLSALMCPQHRSDLIGEIKVKLQAGDPIRVVSTQLIEAGVDIDFPVVYRALAGLDSIAQAAGRCNREGRLGGGKELGKVVVFTPPRPAPAGILRKGAETAKRLLINNAGDPLDHESFTHYFSELYWKVNSLDAKRIKKLLIPDGASLGIQFRSAAEVFRIIDDRLQRTILVPYGEGERLIEKLKRLGPERRLLRSLQRYSVNIYLDQFNKLLSRGSIEEIYPGMFALVCGVEYDAGIGLLVDELPADPTSYMTFV